SQYDNAKDYSLFSCYVDDISSLGKQLSMDILPDLQVAIKKYGDETPALLDHIYFETEPMVEVRKGDTLDFSKAKKSERIQNLQSIKMTKADIEKAKHHLKLLAEKYKKGRENLISDERGTEKWKDELYYETLNRLNEEPLQEGLTGTARIID
ncbi:MAG: hypothetical protein Q7J12_04105, partial [Syntrophales bacterium]|nr:hypothetical protein [Syntrophales bacterium]